MFMQTAIGKSLQVCAECMGTIVFNLNWPHHTSLIFLNDIKMIFEMNHL
jgi:hypothetical protein